MRVRDPVDGPDEIDPAWLYGSERIGVAVGVPASEIPVWPVVDRIRDLTGADVRQLPGADDGVSYPLALVLAAGHIQP